MLNVRFRNQTNTWPAFVDLFSNLVIILIFLLIVFVFLWTTTSVFNKNTGAKVVAELKQANAEQAQQIQQMNADKEQTTQLLVMARDRLQSQEQEYSAMVTDQSAQLGAKQAEIDQMQATIDSLTTQLNQANIDKEQYTKLEQERRDLQTQMNDQRAQLSEQLSKLQAALDAADEKSHQQEIQYVEMSNRLNKALADKVAELNKATEYQSAFYRAIKDALGDRTTVRPDGDRFIVSSDILFSSGSYKLSPEGKKQLQVIANVIKDFENKIPSDVDWIIRVDGHTDRKPVVHGNRAYKNNTELSLLRATAVADELAKAGVSRRRLVPSGFGDMHPVELGTSPDALQKNRRIELQLTNK